MNRNQTAITGLIALTSIFGTLVISDLTDQPAQTVVITVPVPAPTQPSTTTSTTSTTVPPTTTTVKPQPATPALIRKVEQLYPGSTGTYNHTAILKAGDMACHMWLEGSSRMPAVRETNTILNGYGIDDLNLAGIITTAVLWTICPVTKSFPNGPLE